LLVRATLFGLKRLNRQGFAYKKTGVMPIGIAPASRRQLSLLPQHRAGDKSQRLMDVMNQPDQAYGRNTLSVFSSSAHRSGPGGGKICRLATLPSGVMYRSLVPADCHPD
jgi:DNA polymerase V